MEISEMALLTREIADLFEQRGGPWTVPVMMTRLTAEVGFLADRIMMQEGYRPTRMGEPIALEDSFAAILFMTMRLANHYGIDVEQAFRLLMARSRQQLEGTAPS